MSQENVEIVRRYFGALIKRLATYWEDPRSIAEGLKTGDLDLDSREALDLVHPDHDGRTRSASSIKAMRSAPGGSMNSWKPPRPTRCRSRRPPTWAKAGCSPWSASA